jgi:hypothetical protein
MGGHTYIRETDEQRIERLGEMAHKRLRYHPKFRFPNRPKRKTRKAVIAFTAETIARFLSPAKIDGEDDEFSCESLAEAVRGHLLPEIVKRLS